MNPFRSRLWRTVILFLAGLAATYLVALFVAPRWPEFCDDSIVGAPCEPVSIQTTNGYLTIVLGIGTVIFGPIAGSFLEVLINGAKWEAPRGRDTIVSNMPLLVGAAFIAVGVVTLAAR